MNVKKIAQRLEDISAKLDAAGVKGESKTDFDIFVLMLDKTLEKTAVDPSRDLNAADTSRLLSLCDQVEAAICDETCRVALIEQILGEAQSALKAAGIEVSGLSQCSCRRFNIFH